MVSGILKNIMENYVDAYDVGNQPLGLLARYLTRSDPNAIGGAPLSPAFGIPGAPGFEGMPAAMQPPSGGGVTPMAQQADTPALTFEQSRLAGPGAEEEEERGFLDILANRGQPRQQAPQYYTPQQTPGLDTGFHPYARPDLQSSSGGTGILTPILKMLPGIGGLF
jgi:hypothetical protein